MKYLCNDDNRRHGVSETWRYRMDICLTRSRHMDESSRRQGRRKMEETVGPDRIKDMGKGLGMGLDGQAQSVSPWNSFMLLTPSFSLLATLMDPTAISAPCTVVMNGISSSTASLRMV